MSLLIYASLNAAIGHLVDGRVYADVMPDNAKFPNIRIEQDGGSISESMCDTEFDFSVNIDVSAKTAEQRSQLIEEVHSILKDSLNIKLQELPECFWDAQLKVFRGIVTYSILVKS